MKKNIKAVISITTICAVISILLAVTNYITLPIIEKQQNSVVNETLALVLPDGENFEQLDITQYSLPETVTEVYKAENAGYVFKMTTSGYANGFIIMCGIDNEGNVTGTKVVASNETLGIENEYGEKLVGTVVDTIDSVETVSGATRTTLAYRNAVKDALNAFVIIGGGSVDLRDEAQILADNLSSALPSAEGKFTPVFITEELENISAVYKADNNTGFVFLTGETYISTDMQGNVVSETDETLKNHISSQAAKIINSTLTEIDIAAYANMPSHIQKAYKTSSGNYVFQLRAAGFGITGDEWYNPSGEYIYIRVSATPNGKIIACETISQSESEGIGSACGDASFYTQFNGKEEANYKEIDAISGATITTNAYKTAISKMFEAIKILEGEV